MRIVAGEFRGRRLNAPPGRDTRPTTDRIRESLFNLLTHAPWARGLAGQLASGEALVLDAFAGSGALGFEALSRGAAHVWFWDQAPPALGTIRDNAANLDATDRITAVRLDATRPPPAARPVDLLLLDPPYEQGLVARSLPALLAAGWIGFDSLIVIESRRREAEAMQQMAAGQWRLLDQRGIGETALTFLQPPESLP